MVKKKKLVMMVGGKLSYTTDKRKNGFKKFLESNLEIHMRSLKMISHPATLFLGIYFKEVMTDVLKGICKKRLILTMFIIATS